MVFTAIYKWKLKRGVSETDWIENWHKGTLQILKKHGSLGSSLHKTEGGFFVAYARWPNKKAWESMMQDKSPEKKKYSNDPFVTLVEPPILMELIDDQLVKE